MGKTMQVFQMCSGVMEERRVTHFDRVAGVSCLIDLR